MNRTEYKNNFGREHYERINLAVPKGMKDTKEVFVKIITDHCVCFQLQYLSAFIF